MPRVHHEHHIWIYPGFKHNYPRRQIKVVKQLSLGSIMCEKPNNAAGDVAVITQHA